MSGQLNEGSHESALSRIALDSLWAKTPNPNIDGQQHLPLLTHLEDACEAVTHYWNAWLAPIAKRRIISAVGDEDFALRVARWLAAMHDFAKATPVFQGQVPAQRGRLRDARLGLEFSPLGNVKHRLPHGLGGAALVAEQLTRRGWPPTTARSYVSVIAGHHGRYPSLADMARVDDLATLSGVAYPSWSSVHELLFERCRELAGIDDADLAHLSSRPLAATVQLDLQALIVLADWCASDTSDFPLSDPHIVQRRDPRSSADRARSAWHRRAIPGPWSPCRRDGSAADYYRERFGWGVDRTPRITQTRALEIARGVAEPGLVIVEAVMGLGKTELSLAVAETFAERLGCGGVFFGLPTMATSDAVFVRMLDWVRGDPELQTESVYLVHSKAALNRDFAALAHTSDTVTIFDDADASSERFRGRKDRSGRTSAAVIADALSGRRTGILANIVVGTIDQLLMVGLNAKHFALRHLAMSGKVVILDEIHSADRYMRMFLVSALRWLGAYGTPVVLLSATLPPAQREEFVAAYVAGVRHRTRNHGSEAKDHGAASAEERSEPGTAHRGRRRHRVIATEQAAAASSSPTSPMPGGIALDAYPLITWTDGERVLQEAPREGGMRETCVSIVRLDDDLELLVRKLHERTRDGGCVLIVRNTVARAIELYERLQQEPGLCDDLTLAHSRFLAPDRAENDERLRDRFGPPAPGRERPGGRHPAIVISTQVAEQSLDVDFDLLITDLAPADLVLQRIGRLHRHERASRPEALARPTCVLTGVAAWADEVPRPVSGSARVYGEYALLRSILAFGSYSEAEDGLLRLPADVPRIVREAYAEAPAEHRLCAEMLVALEAAGKAQRAEERQAEKRAKVWLLGGPGGVESLYGISDANLSADGDELARAAVRDGEDTFEIILMQRGDDDDTLRTLSTLSEMPGAEVPTQFEVPRGAAARVAAASTVRLPAWMCVRENGERAVEELERQAVPSWQEHPLLRGQLVLVLDEHLEAELAGHRLRYSRERGLDIQRMTVR